MPTHDLVIRGGVLIDGTGAPAYSADVAVDAGVIVEVGSVKGTGRREIRADGAHVTPGFVDLHTHYDGQASWDSRLAPSSWHGVTTVVMGNCGVGFAPVHDEDHERLVQLMEGVEDIPGAALEEGLPWTWNDLPSFLDAIDTPHDIDFAAQVPHGALRLHVMGDRGANREAATQQDIALMAELAADGIRAGCLGFSTSRTLNHRTSTGEPTPTLTADRAELVGIARAIGQTGTGVLQVVGDFLDLNEEFGHLEAMATASRRPLSFSLLQTSEKPGLWRGLLDRLDQANASGLTIRAQVAPRAIGVLLGLECTLNPFMGSPVYKAIQSLPIGQRVKSMSEPIVRSAILAETESRPGAFPWANMYTIDGVLDYEPSASASVEASADRHGITPAQFAYDHLLGANGSALFYVPYMNYAYGNLDAVREMMMHEFTIPGLSDGGAHVGTICDASFPTFALTHWGRDRQQGQIPLEYLIQQQSRDTAQAVGLTDRGVICAGYRADLNVLSMEELALERPTVVHDLPAGGRRLMQRASGYMHTFVAGTETYADGEATGELPGRLIRGQT